MKLIIEKHPESYRLSQFFKKIESIAERKGIEVDDLISDAGIKKTGMHTFSKKSMLSIAKKRTDLFFNGRTSAEDVSTSEQTIHSNTEGLDRSQAEQ